VHTTREGSGGKLSQKYTTKSATFITPGIKLNRFILFARAKSIFRRFRVRLFFECFSSLGRAVHRDFYLFVFFFFFFFFIFFYFFFMFPSVSVLSHGKRCETIESGSFGSSSVTRITDQSLKSVLKHRFFMKNKNISRGFSTYRY